MELVINPQLPYVGSISNNFTPGKWLKIYGSVPAQARRFTISLQCSVETAAPDDVAIQILISIPDNNLSVNSMRTSIWDEAQTILGIPIKCEQKFEIAITYDFTQYKIFINGEHYCEFPQRISHDRITHLAIDGDVSIEKIFYGTEPSASSGANQPSQLGFIRKTETPPPSYSDVQSRTYAPNAMNYGACSIPAPTSGMSPYPTAGPFVPALPAYQPYAVQPDAYPMHSGTMIPLNAASSNFRPVSPSKRKKYASWACTIFIIILLVAIALFNSTSRKHHNRHDHHHDWDS